MGSKNYRIFSLLLAATLSSLAIYISSVVVLWTQNDYHNYIAEMGVVWASGIIVIVVTLLVLNLTVLHIFLWVIGMTTYEYITQDKPPKSVPSLPEYVPKEQELTQEKLEVKA